MFRGVELDGFLELGQFLTARQLAARIDRRYSSMKTYLSHEPLSLMRIKTSVRTGGGGWCYVSDETMVAHKAESTDEI